MCRSAQRAIEGRQSLRAFGCAQVGAIVACRLRLLSDLAASPINREAGGRGMVMLARSEVGDWDELKPYEQVTLVKKG